MVSILNWFTGFVKLVNMSPSRWCMNGNADGRVPEIGQLVPILPECANCLLSACFCVCFLIATHLIRAVISFIGSQNVYEYI